MYSCGSCKTGWISVITHEVPHSTTDVAYQLEAATQYCQVNGARLTSSRRAVLQLLLEQPGGVKAYQLLEALRANNPDVAPPVVYRALAFLQRMGLVHRLDSLNAFVACSLGQHECSVLLVCPDCGAVKELLVPDLARQLHELAMCSGFALQGHCVEIKAFCAQCAQVQAPHGPSCS